MGVPKFYRWISERYPCLSEVVREYQIPEFDNLYLDMNGIIHNCSHPNDDDVHFRITEEKIFADIFHYIEVLFRLIRPRKLFFMAVDGVAPRAKMNQQRGRRFRSAREALKQEEEAKRKGESLPAEERFDSNCITPGTEFMVKLQEQLKYLVTKKVSTDPLWQGCQIILSGHETPGEGEHKIMEYIRYQKSQPGYNPNTRHCLYGLDADLMMLGLCTHEPHFALLREEVRFGKKNNQRASTPEETTFHLLHLSLMREYLDLEFSSLKDKLPFGYDLEHIIDDWILMGFLVGNDFIPNLPHFHIAKGTLPILYKSYMSVLPSMDGYINENGKLNMPRFAKFMSKLAEVDTDYFQDIYDDLKYLKGKRSKAAEQSPDFAPMTPRSKEVSKFLQDQDDALKDLLGCSSSEEDECETEQDLFDMEFLQHKKAYYKEKMDGDGSDAYLKDQAESYVRAIQWNLFYYYDGVPSWSWYFPHHYAPYVSDIKDFADLNFQFDLSKPFLPYQQLLGVLPAASRKLLPQAFQNLMTSEMSPILDFYPTDFETDLNGKQQDWEAVVLIPFIDEKRLIKAMEECESSLTDEEKKRNSHGPMYSYVYTPNDLGRYDAPKYFPPVMHHHAKCTPMFREELAIERSKIRRGLCPGVRLDLYHQGFPTLKHLKFRFYLSDHKVKVFQQPSMGKSMILELLPREDSVDLEALSKQLIGKTVYVEWPHLVEAKVLAVADRDTHYSIDPSTEKLKVTSMNSDLQSAWKLQEGSIREKYSNRFGVKIGETEVLIYATQLTGRTYAVTNNGVVTLEKSWAKDPTPYALQAVVQELQVAEESTPKFKTLEELYPAGSMCFVLVEEYYGAPACIVEHLKEEKGKLRVSIELHSEPHIERNANSEDYARGFVVADELRISSHLLSRITGTVYITSEEKKKYNVGLNLKLNKKNEEVPGWTKKVNGDWCYSFKTQDALAEMRRKFPELFEYLSRSTGDDMYQESQIFPNSEGRLKELVAWVAALPCHKVEKQTCGMPYLDESAVKKLEAAITSNRQGVKKYLSKVKPKILYKPSNYQGSALPDPTTTFELYDRVVNVREGFPVPQGYHGTVIGIRNWNKNISDVVLEVLFDKEFPDGMSIRGCSAGKGYLMPSYTVINLSHGRRIFGKLGSSNAQQANEQPIGFTVAQPKGNQRNYKNVPPPSGLNERSNGGRSNSFNRNKNEFSNDASPRKLRNNQQQDAQAFGRSFGEKSTVPQKEERQTRILQSSVSLSEAAKKLPQRMNFVRGDSLPGNVKSTEDLTKELQAVLNIGTAAPAPNTPQSISFEALASGSRKPVQPAAQQPASVSVQALLDSARYPAAKVPVTQGPNACFQLIDVLTRMGLGVPLYHYSQIDRGAVQATINLKTGAVFKGDVMTNQEQAAESAARYALASLQSGQPFGQFPPHASAVTMPNFFGQAQPIRFPHMPFGGGYPQYPQYMPPRPGALPPLLGYAPPMTNPSFRGQVNSSFVPPQVQRQGQRGHRQKEKERVESEPTKPAPSVSSAQTPPRQPSVQRSSQPREPREPRKPKLAAKFSNV